MVTKTISGHYGTVFSLAHNNRRFSPRNVDPSRTPNNYNCIVAGEVAIMDFADPRLLDELWKRYKILDKMYWSNRSLADFREYEHYRETMRELWRCRQMVRINPDNVVGLFFALLLLPLTIIGDAALLVCEVKTKREHAEYLKEKLAQRWEYEASKYCARELLRHHDLKTGSKWLSEMDTIMRDTARLAGNLIDASPCKDLRYREPDRWATLDEIYDKVFEPSFREFQERQRPCRRYNGTYLEYIRDGQGEMLRKKSLNKNTRNRKISEAIEIVIGIGDMDNTGYVAAPEDAKKSEMLLKDYCDHLVSQKNVCFVTTRELEDPNWKPPFYNGLIVLNMVVHADEACPGIHLTVIPYSRNCKRGPAVQASLGAAMKGMGYPSTWKDVTDSDGNKIPKRDRENKIVHNKDGSIRYQMEPDKQGIIDWIEDQKRWIHQEMQSRYGWEREYKGSHPRGNLSTPDYKVARAAERLKEIERQAEEIRAEFDAHIENQIDRLDSSVDTMWRTSDSWDMILRFLNTCSDDEYERYVKRAKDYLDTLPMNEKEKAKKQLAQLISAAEQRAVASQTQSTPKNKAKEAVLE